MYISSFKIINHIPSKVTFELHTSLFVMLLFLANLLGSFKNKYYAKNSNRTARTYLFK